MFMHTYIYLYARVYVFMQIYIGNKHRCTVGLLRRFCRQVFRFLSVGAMFVYLLYLLLCLYVVAFVAVIAAIAVSAR